MTTEEEAILKEEIEKLRSRLKDVPLDNFPLVDFFKLNDYIALIMKEAELKGFLAGQEAERKSKEDNYRKGWDDGIIEGKKNFDDLYNSFVEEKERLEQQLKDKEEEIRKLNKINCDFNDWITNLQQQLSSQKEKILEIFNRFDEYSCIKDDKWYKDLKEESLKNKIEGENK